jgi:hypothetical protein
MDFITLFVFFGFPISVLILCWVGVMMHERRGRRDDERRERQAAASFARLAATQD